MNRPARRPLVLLATCAALLLSGCSSHGAAAGLAASELASGQFSANDLMFAAMMVPHHAQAVELSELALERSEHAELRALAERILAAQSAEIEQMSAWLELTDGHGGGGMHEHGDAHGMLSESELDALAAASGSEFDRLFLEGMIAHHEGAIEMAELVTSSSNPEARALGEAIVATQRDEIGYMRELLAGLD